MTFQAKIRQRLVLSVNKVSYESTVLVADWFALLSKWEDAFFSAVDYFVPKIVIKSSYKPPYITQEIIHYLNRVIMSSDLKWNCHVDHIIKKGSKKLYSLRVLRRAGVENDNILKVYLTTVRPVLEYAVPVWQAIPDYLSEAIEVVQRDHLKLSILSVIRTQTH